IIPLVFTTQIPVLFNDPTTGAMGPLPALISIGMFMLVSLVPFPIYGALISKRGQARNEEQRKQNEARGGSLRHPGRVVNLDDLQALPLDKFGSWVGRLFANNDFTMIDYKFDKEFVDLQLQRKDPEEKWLVRCTVVEAVKPGMVQSLGQDVREGEYAKGVVAASTTIQDGARKWAKTRGNIEVLDGETLIDMD
ncbi:MAG TPA: restriction endonuclease, partial [Herpetosiphonaceae bacterium]